MKIEHHHFETLNSTNTWAKENAHTFSKNAITLITADQQTAGRGRYNRNWISPPNENVYATFCFFLEKNMSNIGNIPQILAISASQVLQNLGFAPVLKWPNDILIANNKICGILSETTTIDENFCVILGIGINVNMPLEQLQKIDRPATSLYNESGKHFSTKEICNKLSETFNKNLTIFFDQGFAFFLTSYIKLLSHKPGDTISFHDNQKLWHGTFHSINSDGSLNLILTSGEIKNFVAGEIQ